MSNDPRQTTRLSRQLGAWAALLVSSAALPACSSDSDTSTTTEPVTPGASCPSNGATAPSIDGCNTCTCEGGIWACTERACGGGGAAGGGAAGGGMGGTTASTSWFTTCGNPVCGPGGSTSTGATPCATSATEGGACDVEGELCDPGLGCGTNLVCASVDPKTGPGGCPISRARFKEDIEYVTQAERAEYARRVLATPLATWRYKNADDAREHLGFIIEDVEPSPSVESSRDRVDLYGYTTMMLAALQEQAGEMAALRAEVQALRSAAEGATKTCGGAAPDH